MTSGADLRAIIALARGLEDGANCDEDIRVALAAAIARRKGADGPPPPIFGALSVRRDGLPHWWGRDNLLLAAPDARIELASGFAIGPGVGNVAVVGEGAAVGKFVFVNDDNLIGVGAQVGMLLGELSAMNGATILIGEDATSGQWARVDARNGGAVLVGRGAMWEDDVKLLTDDMHAIRELDGGRRANPYGGRIVVAPHVWLRERAWLAGGACVGAHSVVEIGSFVRSALPGGTVSLGWPARPVRRGVTWTREDLP